MKARQHYVAQAIKAYGAFPYRVNFGCGLLILSGSHIFNFKAIFLSLLDALRLGHGNSHALSSSYPLPVGTLRLEIGHSVPESVESFQI